MRGVYGKGKWCPDAAKPDRCLNIDEITKLLATSRNETEIRNAWEGWHTISPPIRRDYQRFVELSNKGAKELGFADTGAMWRAKYDMPPDAFTAELDRLWNQVRPLYLQLHAYVRMKLRQKYGDAVPANGPLPAHLLGNIWAQDWSNVYDLTAPAHADAGFSLTDILKRRKMSAIDMVKTGERFYTSLGFEPLPVTFWERSLFVRPKDREVVCHASAWDVDYEKDVRLKMCIQINEEDFTTVHHELGHNYYQMAYAGQPFLYRDSANDGFHEAIGDTMALSVTPPYLKQIGLIDKVPDQSAVIVARPMPPSGPRWRARLAGAGARSSLGGSSAPRSPSGRTDAPTSSPPAAALTGKTLPSIVENDPSKVPLRPRLMNIAVTSDLLRREANAAAIGSTSSSGIVPSDIKRMTRPVNLN